MENILVAIDFSEGTGRIVEQAVELGKNMKAAVCVLHATSDALQAAYVSSQFYEISPEYSPPLLGDVEMAREICAKKYRREHESLLKISGRMRNEGLNARAMLLEGDAAELIVEKAEELNSDIVIMGSHGHGLLRKMLVGSVTEAVLRQAHCNVLIVPAKPAVPLL